MKLRIKGDSIRLRLTRSEVAAMVSEGRVAESVHFAPGSVLTYVLARSSTATEVAVTFDGKEARVGVAPSVVDAWAKGDEVGFERSVDVGEGRSLRVLVEKDWKCLTGRDEDESDAYENPHTHC